MRLVVGAAIVRDGRLLAARRRTPPVGWEFPGGKVEDGESDVGALLRECREELGVTIEAGGLLGEVAHGPIVLRVYLAGLVDREPQPLTDHDELRWCAAGELDALDWLPADRSLLDAVRAAMRER